ncbi:MAG: hypothetical protein ACREKH_07700, partial [Candidatus Rokuibacteriota bacterium]
MSDPGRTGEFEIGSLRPDEAGAVARLHVEFFHDAGGRYGHSLANLGAGFLEHVFYGLNLDNPRFFVDVVRYRERLVGFSVYVSDHRALFRHALARHPGALLRFMAKLTARRPRLVATHILGNLASLTASVPAPARAIPGWYMLLGFKPEYGILLAARQRATAGGDGPRPSVVDDLVARMETTLWEHGCREYWAAPFVQNAAANRVFARIGAELFARGSIQGLPCNYYRK